MKSILNTATIAAAAIALTAGTAFSRDWHPMKFTNAHGQQMTLYRYSTGSGATIGFYGHGRSLGEKRMMWEGRELTEPMVMRDAKGREFVVFKMNR
jgi:hypothetical protein